MNAIPERTSVIAPTTSGPVRGERSDGFIVFRGVRYAAPPVGPGRFRPPTPPAPWSDAADCTAAGPVAPQLPSPAEAMFRKTEPPPQSEDCLFLNVWTPACDDGRRPVMVWIHGGAFAIGSGSAPGYEGFSFAQRHDIVVVTINYRLGALGFSHLADHADGYEGSGNAAILDQALALAWVRDNIASFGGDPAKVTVFGESSGAMSVATLLAMPTVHGLVHRGIAQSGAAGSVRSRDVAKDTTERLLEILGCTVDELVAMPVERLLDGQDQLLREMPDLPFRPVVDGTTLPSVPLDAISGGSSAGVPLLVGTNLHEGSMFALFDPTVGELDAAGLRARAAALGAGEVIDTYLAERPGATPSAIWSAFLTDQRFRVPAIRLSGAQSSHAPTYAYLFTWESPAFDGVLGACHGLEIPFAFNLLTGDAASVLTGEATDQSQVLALQIHDAWAAFARSGNPNHPGLPHWPAFSPGRRETMILGVPCEAVSDPGGNELAAWDALIGEG